MGETTPGHGPGVVSLHRFRPWMNTGAQVQDGRAQPPCALRLTGFTTPNKRKAPGGGLPKRVAERYRFSPGTPSP
jgi:hypothetical protein